MSLQEFHKQVIVNKQAPRHDQRTLKLASYSVELPPAPQSYRLAGIPETTPTLYGNDEVGDCTKAAYAEEVYTLSSAAGKPFNYTDTEVLDMYAQCDGWVKGDPRTDNGSDGLTTLKFLTKSGAYGHAPLAYLGINFRHAHDLRLALRYFGGAYTGIRLPQAWQGSKEWGTSWWGARGRWAPGSWGGHMVYLRPSYNTDHIEVFTWGEVYQLTWKAASTYIDESWAILVPDFKSPDGFDDVKLRQDLAQVQ